MLFYNSFEQFGFNNPNNKVLKSDLIKTQKILITDFEYVKEDVKKKRNNLRKVGISWDLFIWDTILTATYTYTQR